MSWLGKNKTTFSVAFTEDAADQTLLSAVERELTQAKYQTFSNLCKQALWQFLSISGAAGTGTLGPETAPGTWRRLEEQLLELGRRLAEYEQKLSVQNSQGLANLEGLLLQLAQQMDELRSQLEQGGTVAGPLHPSQGALPLSVGLTAPGLSLGTEIASDLKASPSQATEGTSSEAMPLPEEDPVLARLGKLLDTF